MSSAKTIVITGGTRGIGLGLVRSCAAAGANVVFCGRDAGRVAQVQSTVDGSLGVVADVTDREAVQQLWDTAQDRHGAVDIWLNNAGIAPAQVPMWELTHEELDAILDTNLRSLLHGCRIAFNGMLKQGHGALWNMMGFGTDGMIMPGMATYGTTKIAAFYLTNSLIAEAKGTPVTVHACNPGVVMTEMTLNMISPEHEAKMKKFLNVLADPVEVVTPWLAEKILAGGPNGSSAMWLTKSKALWRFATAGFRKRDLFRET